MSILSSTGRISLVREPVSGRFGLPRLLAKVSANAYKTNWNGCEEISVVTFNKRRSIAKIIHIDKYGVDLTSRQLNHGTFRIMLEEGLLPKSLKREELEILLQGGTLGNTEEQLPAGAGRTNMSGPSQNQHIAA